MLGSGIVSPPALYAVAATAEHLEIPRLCLSAFRPRHDMVALHLFVSVDAHGIRAAALFLAVDIAGYKIADSYFVELYFHCGDLPCFSDWIYRIDRTVCLTRRRGDAERFCRVERIEEGISCASRNDALVAPTPPPRLRISA